MTYKVKVINSCQPQLEKHEHVKADTLVIVQTNNVAKRDPFMEFYIYLPGTDVSLLFIHRCQMLTHVNIHKSS